jgi:hypothetical protein
MEEKFIRRAKWAGKQEVKRFREIPTFLSFHSLTFLPFTF